MNKQITVTSKAELNIRLVSAAVALLVCLGAFTIASYLSWDGTRIYLELEQSMFMREAAMLSGFLSLLIVGTGLTATMMGRVAGVMLLAISFATAGLSAYSIQTGKNANLSATVIDQRKLSDEYHQLRASIDRHDDKLKSHMKRAATIDGQMSSALANIETLNASTASIAAEKCEGKFATRCHNQKQETMRRMRKTKTADQGAIKQLKADREALSQTEKDTGYQLKLARAELKKYNVATQQIITKQQHEKRNNNMIWSVLPDLSTALMSFLIGKIIIAMSLIVREKQVLQDHITRKQELKTRQTSLVNPCLDLDLEPEIAPMPDAVVERMTAHQSSRNLDPTQAEWEYRECITQGTAPLKIGTVTKHFPALNYAIIKSILEETFEQKMLNRTVRYRADGSIHQSRYSYPLPGEEGGQETSTHPVKKATSWNTPNHHEKAQLSLVH